MNPIILLPSYHILKENLRRLLGYTYPAQFPAMKKIRSQHCFCVREQNVSLFNYWAKSACGPPTAYYLDFSKKQLFLYLLHFCYSLSYRGIDQRDLSSGGLRSRVNQEQRFDPKFVVNNHVGARHCRKPLGWRKGFNIFITLGFPKIRDV